MNRRGRKVLGEKKMMIGVTVAPEIIAALERYAIANFETASGCARRFIVERLRAEGALPALTLPAPNGGSDAAKN